MSGSPAIFFHWLTSGVNQLQIWVGLVSNKSFCNNLHQSLRQCSELCILLGTKSCFFRNWKDKLEKITGTKQLYVELMARPSNPGSAEIFSPDCLVLWAVLRSNPFSAKQWISQMQLAVTSRAKYYKKIMARPNFGSFKTVWVTSNYFIKKAVSSEIS